MNVPWIVFVILIALGFMGIVLEFFVPGMVLGAIGGFLMLLAVVAAFIDGPVTGVWTLVVAAVSSGVAVLMGMKILPETPVTLRQTHGPDEGFVSGPEGLAKLVGKQGWSVTPLRPAGLVEIEGKKIDVVTEGEMIGPGTPVEVLRVEGSRVIVRTQRPTQVHPTSPQG